MSKATTKLISIYYDNCCWSGFGRKEIVWKSANILSGSEWILSMWHNQIWLKLSCTRRVEPARGVWYLLNYYKTGLSSAFLLNLENSRAHGVLSKCKWKCTRHMVHGSSHSHSHDDGPVVKLIGVSLDYDVKLTPYSRVSTAQCHKSLCRKYFYFWVFILHRLLWHCFHLIWCYLLII